MYLRRGLRLQGIVDLFKLAADKVDTASLMRRVNRILAQGRSPKK